MSNQQAPLFRKYVKRGVFYHASAEEKDVIKKNEWCTIKPFDAAILGVEWSYEDLDMSCVGKDGKVSKRLVFLPGREPPDREIHVYSFIGYATNKIVEDEMLEWIASPIFAFRLQKIATFGSWRDIRKGSKAFLGL